MKIYKTIFALLILIVTCQVKTFAQKDASVLPQVITTAAQILHDYPQEKIYLHLDKPYYAVADTVWFKAYITENQNLLSQLSKVLYVDLFNSRDSLMQTIKLPVTSGMAYGNFPLTQLNYKQGNYHLRAYTTWMLNFENPAYFTKTLYIGEAIDKQLVTHITYANTSAEKQAKIDAKIQFKDLSGKPYGGRTVNWKVISNYETISKGKGVTDLYGNLKLSITGGQKSEYPLNTGELFTSLDLPDNETLGSRFSLKSAWVTKDIQFFPEGGTFIAGLPVKVAFKAIRSDGIGIGAKGVITDSKGNQVAVFTSRHLGMGHFSMQPETDENYKASVTFNDGTQQTFNLPKVENAGISLSLNNADPEKLIVQIAANTAYLNDNLNKKIFLTAQSKGTIAYASETTLGDKTYTAVIPKSKFPEGIVQITLHAANGEPLSERLVFIRSNKPLNVALSSAVNTYGTRKKVKINVNAQKAGLPAPGNFSVSVIDESKVPFNEDGATTILSSLLLNSDLKGYIEKPNYYFNQPNEKKTEDLDVLLLTQGYRQFLYNNIASGNLPQIAYLPEQGIEISGVLRMQNGIPVRKGALLLTIPDKRISKDTITDPVGNFKFSNLVFNDSSKVTISAKYNVNSKNMVITLNGSPEPRQSKNLNAPDEIVNIDSTLGAYLNNSKRQYSYLHVLKDVTIKGTPEKKPSHADYPSLSGLSSVPDQLIPGDRLSGCNLILNCLQTMGNGIQYDATTNNFYVRRDYQAGNRTPMGIFMNGMSVDINHLGSISAPEIESVEIFLKDELGLVNKSNNCNGVIVINSKKVKKVSISKAELQSLIPQYNVITYSPQGYNKERQFYSPKYEVAATAASGNDLRTTIYWNPKIVTGKEGSASFEYFNADGKGTYKVVIEGIDQDGNIARGIYRYTVK